MVDSDIDVEIVGGYVIIKNENGKSVLDSEDVRNLLQQFSENENKVSGLIKEFSELKAMMGAK